MKKPTSPIRAPLETLGLIFLSGLLATLIFLLHGCGEWDPEFYCAGSATSPITQKIVGGQVSTDRRATVALGRAGQLQCSGVAISPNTVLTAAHCRSFTGVLVPAQLGSQELWYEYEVVDVLVHPSYDLEAETWPGPKFDLAMMFVSVPLPGPYASIIYDPAAGGFEEDLRKACTGLVAQGFGWHEETGVGILRESPYEVGNLDTWNLSGLGTAGESICGSDSGGPLYAYVEGHPYAPERTLMLAGTHVATHRRVPGEPCYGPSTHINLINFKPWIEENVR